MDNKIYLPADGTAKRIVHHFQAEGFAGITEGLIIRIRLKKGDQESVQVAFDDAAAAETPPPMQEFFEVHPYGFYSEIRDFAATKAAFKADFGMTLRRELNSMYFDTAPLMVNDAMASGTKYDAMLKLNNNIDGYALAFLLNDPTSSFFEYLGEHRGYDWQKILGDFGAVATSFGIEFELM